MVRVGSTLTADVEIALQERGARIGQLPLEGVTELRLCMRRHDRLEVVELSQLVRLHGALAKRGRRLALTNASRVLIEQLRGLGLAGLFPVRQPAFTPDPTPVATAP